jgi:hypothetical protein
MELGDVGCEDMDSVDLVQDIDLWRAAIYTVMNLWVP